MDESKPDSDTADSHTSERTERLTRTSVDGSRSIDAMCGRVSSLGLVDPAISAVFQDSFSGELGDGFDPTGRDDEKDLGADLFTQVQSIVTDHAADCLDLGHVSVHASPDAAVEAAVRWARTRGVTGSGANAGAANRFRVITLIGHDHGRSVMCRTLSGRPELHQDFGPLVPGVHYCPADDLRALQSIIDDTIAAVMISPTNLDDGCRQLSASYLTEVAALCHQQSIPLIVDESRLSFAATARPFAFQDIASVGVDAVILSAGLFAGLSGGMLLGSRDMQSLVGDAPPENFDGSKFDGSKFDGANPDQDGTSESSFPPAPAAVIAAGTTLQARLAGATLARLAELDVWQQGDAATEFATELAQAIGGFEFVRDMQVLGMTIGIDTDIPGTEIVDAAAKHGVRVEISGDTSVRLQLPIVVSHDREDCIAQLTTSFESIERQTIEL